jgi:hypothetical protein
MMRYESAAADNAQPVTVKAWAWKLAFSVMAVPSLTG